MEDLNEWAKIEYAYLKEQGPLREAWINGDEEAGKKLKEVVAKYTALCPPLTGTFTYTDADVKRAEEAGF